MPDIKGPGMLWVTSRIAPGACDILSEEQFLKWYDDDHIAEIVAKDGIPSAFRYIHTTPQTVQKPYLAVYPMPELEYIQGEEFRKIRVKSDLLPGSGIVYDLGDIDVAYYGIVGQTYRRDGKEEQEAYLLVSAVEPADEKPDETLDGFYNDQTEKVAEARGYIRSLRFRLLYARSNAQSRKLKGLPTTDEPPPEPPTWQVVHTFSDEPARDVVNKLRGETGGVVKDAKQNEVHVYKLAKVHGRGRLFE